MPSKIVWDAQGEHRWENGVSCGVLYPTTTDTDTDVTTYGTGVPWNGLTSVQESPDGADANDLWADNTKYAVLRSAETFGFSISAYTYPDEFGDCDGSNTIVPGVYVGQQIRKPFGFSYKSNVGNEVDLEDGYKLHLIYNATASPSDREYATVNDSPDAIEFSWECTTTPVSLADYDPKLKPVSEITIDTTKLDSAGKGKLEALEKILYGSNTADATLPSPATVLGMFKTNTSGT